MRRISPLIATLLVAATATAAVEFFFTASHDIYGLRNPALAFKATNGNGTDFVDGYELTKDANGYLSPPPGCPLPDVVLDCNQVEPPWAYIWGRFVDEPPGAKINGIAIEIVGAGAGPENIAWYKCDNLNDFNIPLQFKRWDGDNNVFYFNPAGLVAITAYGVRNIPANNATTAANLQAWDANRLTSTFLLGAVACPKPCGYKELTINVSAVSYATPPDPQWAACNKVICIPEPTSLAMLVLAGALVRRR